MQCDFRSVLLAFIFFFLWLFRIRWYLCVCLFCELVVNLGRCCVCVGVTVFVCSWTFYVIACKIIFKKKHTRSSEMHIIICAHKPDALFQWGLRHKHTPFSQSFYHCIVLCVCVCICMCIVVYLYACCRQIVEHNGLDSCAGFVCRLGLKYMDWTNIVRFRREVKAKTAAIVFASKFSMCMWVGRFCDNL